MTITNTADEDPLKRLVDVVFGGGIEWQEARGQQEMVSSCQLPLEGLEHILEMGVKLIGPTDGDSLFAAVELPEGWSKRATEHSMWSVLVDNKGRKRASIFYKAAFYDRSAFIRAVPRFHCTEEPLGGFSAPDYDYNTTPRVGCIKDSDGNVIWESEPFPVPESGPAYRASDIANSAALAKISKMFPNYRDISAYWD